MDATLNRTTSSGIEGASYYEGLLSNISRCDATGEYVATTNRGNFYLTWIPGAYNWEPHNRPAGRRLQNLGWTPEGRLWATTRGGDVYLGNESGVTDLFDKSKLTSRGYGILDVGFSTQDLGFAVGGSGTLYKTEDGGRSWKRDKGIEDLPGNLYLCKFFSPKDGYILGSGGIFLRYRG